MPTAPPNIMEILKLYVVQLFAWDHFYADTTWEANKGPPICNSKVENTIPLFKNNKATGFDNIHSENPMQNGQSVS